MADHKFEKKIRDRLADYHEQPPEGLWATISGKIPVRKTVTGYKVIIVAAILLLMGSGYFYLDGTNALNEEPAISSPEVSSKSQMKELKMGKSGDTEEVMENSEGQKSNHNPQGILKNDMSVSKEDNLSGSSVANKENTHSDEMVFFTTEKVASKGYQFSNPEMAQLRIIPVLVNIPGHPEMEKDADKKDDKDEGNKRLTTYFYGMPMLSYNRVESNTNDNLFIAGIEKIPALSGKRMGFRLELGIAYEFTPMLGAFGGLMYYSRKQEMNYTIRSVEGVVGNQGDGSILYTPVYVLEEMIYNNNISNAGFHLGLLLDLSSAHFSQKLGSGMEYHIPLLKSGSTPSYSIFYNLFYRIEYPREGNFRALLQPTFNYSLSTENTVDAPFYVSPYGIGLNAGVSYRF